LQSIGGDPTSYYRQRECRLRLKEEEEYEDDDDEDADMMAIIGHGRNASLFEIHRRYGDF